MHPQDTQYLTGPFDIIGDIHGCFYELTKLVKQLNYKENGEHPDNRQLIFLGDITDRGPNSIECITFVTELVKNKRALYVPGNHCNKLYRYLLGRNVTIAHGLETTVKELHSLSKNEHEAISTSFINLVENAPPYLILDHGNLVVSHAGIKESLIGKDNRRTRDFCLYGDVDGRTLPNGRPFRKDWAKEYLGKALIVYGHTPVREPRWLNNTVNIDQGCVFGGHLTALRYPERTTVMVKSQIDSTTIEDNPLFQELLEIHLV